MKIHIYTNPIPGGWDPSSPFLKGSEECIKNLAEAINNYSDHDVTVFTDIDPLVSEYEIPLCLYKPREEVFSEDCDILIVWKDREIDLGQVAMLTKVIKWSSDVEDHYDIDYIDAWVNLTKYHSDSNAWVPKEIEQVIPHGIDVNFLQKHTCDKEENTMLYSSSLDRGLFTLLQDWPRIKENYPQMKLKVTYGTEEIRKFGGNDVHNRFIGSMQPLINQPDIEYLGCVTDEEMARLYHKSKYWILPLNKPQAELFCLNAYKACYADCIPVINHIGALSSAQNGAIDYYLDYEDFKNGKILNKQSPKYTEVLNQVEIDEQVDQYGYAYDFPFKWYEVYHKYWGPLFNKLSNKDT